jgi:hypothetical protein
VIAWPVLLALAYLAAIVVGLVLSLTTHRQPRGNGIQFATFALIAPVILGLVGVIVLRFTILREPPTLGELQRDFPSKRTDLETIVHMSDEDANFSRIAPDFLDRNMGPNGFGRYAEDDPKAGLPRLRWDAYRKIYSRNGIRLGIQRDASRDVFIMVDSVGLLNRGHVSGYLYCAPGAPPDFNRYYPCMSHQEKGKREYDPESRDEGYSFQKLDGLWYAYDEGPS